AGGMPSCWRVRGVGGTSGQADSVLESGRAVREAVGDPWPARRTMPTTAPPHRADGRPCAANRSACSATRALDSIWQRSPLAGDRAMVVPWPAPTSTGGRARAAQARPDPDPMMHASAQPEVGRREPRRAGPGQSDCIARRRGVFVRARSRHPSAMPVPAAAASPDPAHAALTGLSGVGPAVAGKLAARGLSTLQDLWLHLPRQYEDRTRITPVRALQPGVAAQVEGAVEAVERGFRYRPLL